MKKSIVLNQMYHFHGLNKLQNLLFHGADFLSSLPGCEEYSRLMSISQKIIERLCKIDDSMLSNDLGELLVSYSHETKLIDGSTKTEHLLSQEHWKRAVECTNAIRDAMQIAMDEIPGEKERIDTLKKACNFSDRVRMCANCKFVDEADGDLQSKAFCGNPENASPDSKVPDGEATTFFVHGECVCKFHKFKDED